MTQAARSNLVDAASAVLVAGAHAAGKLAPSARGSRSSCRTTARTSGSPIWVTLPRSSASTKHWQSSQPRLVAGDRAGAVAVGLPGLRQERKVETRRMERELQHAERGGVAGDPPAVGAQGVAAAAAGAHHELAQASRRIGDAGNSGRR